MTTVMWFRRDLRLGDNRALARAAHSSPEGVVGLFVIDEGLLARVGPTRARYVAESVAKLDESMGGRLVVRRGPPDVVLREVAREYRAARVVATADFSPAGRLREARVRDRLSDEGVAFELVDSPYLVAPGAVRGAQGAPLKVFGAYYRRWLTHHVESPLELADVNFLEGDSLDATVIAHVAGQRWPEYFGDLVELPTASIPSAGESKAWEVLDDFVSRVERYSEVRDRPDVDQTSRLSPFLHTGAIHPRQVVHRVAGRGEAAESFVRQLAWRDFYADVLFHWPRSRDESMQRALVDLEVDRDARARERFRAWARGETGERLVDAGMVQLLEEGWMHNRARMVTASYLVKHLHLDWRWGAQWFLWRLVDGDVASNQHGWQWTAGTGTDAAPFHRIFNPRRQAERFDPEGRYVERYARSGVAGATLLGELAHPAMVDLDDERREALARFARARARASASAGDRP